uniref:Transcription factor CBF/NF-Y/archaeal histone domain-containing protein n=1 Tax=Marmota marmota marmota TaxID=9994 RepID=A0A8C5ZDF1_MARMA
MADVAVGKDKCGEQRLMSLPLSRIRVIMKSSPEVSSINQEALVLTAKATELFRNFKVRLNVGFLFCFWQKKEERTCIGQNKTGGESNEVK